MICGSVEKGRSVMYDDVRTPVGTPTADGNSKKIPILNCLHHLCFDLHGFLDPRFTLLPAK